MFTLKIFRTNDNGDERVDIYETPHPEVYVRKGAQGLPYREVTWREPGTEEWPVVVIDPENNSPMSSNGCWEATQVVIENAAGKTTEVIRG